MQTLLCQIDGIPVSLAEISDRRLTLDFDLIDLLDLKTQKLVTKSYGVSNFTRDVVICWIGLAGFFWSAFFGWRVDYFYPDQ